MGFRPCWCPSPSISRCFSIHSLPAIGFHQGFFFTTDVSAPVRSTLHLLFNFCPDRGLNLGPCSQMVAYVTTRLQRDPFRRLLRCRMIERDNSNPEHAGFDTRTFIYGQLKPPLNSRVRLLPNIYQRFL